MRIFLSILLVLLLVPSWTGEPRRSLYARGARMGMEQVALFPGDPARVKLGALTYLGGVRLTSNDPAFGGFSAMTLVGDRFTLLSDAGTFVQFRWRPFGRASDISFHDLPDGPGYGWEKADRDSESIAVDPATGTTWVAFERFNQIWRYSAGLGQATGHAAPPAMRRWPSNSGAEAMVRLRSGQFVVLGESAVDERRMLRPAILFADDPAVDPDTVIRFVYRVPERGFDPSDIAELPDGRLLVLNRAYALPARFTTIVTLVDPRHVRADGVLKGREIARFEAPSLSDNFEAMAVVQEGDQTIVWIASDDNQFFLQQSLLLKFRLDLPG